MKIIPCPYLDSRVSVVQAADDALGNDPTKPLDRSGDWCVLA
jgi:hypothetical protein